MAKRTYSGPLYDRMVAKEFTIEKYAKCLSVERRAITRMLDGDNCVHKQIRAYAARILDLTEKEFVGLVEQQKVHGKALKRWRVFSRFFTYVNFGLLENVADIKLLGIVPEKIQMVQDWSTRMLEQLQQSAPVTPTKNKQVKTHIPLPVLTKKSIRPLPLRTGTNG